jgi:16S rRNA (cytosine1402-N4)-methyltransferase
MMTDYHNPVLLHASVDGLDIKPDGVYVDVTFGGGGHSKEILSRLGPNGKLFAFDQDEDALANALDDERFVLINENFRFIKRFLRFHNIKSVDGILADLGVSSHQFDVAERGFSTRFDAELDMRMSKKNEVSAFQIVKIVLSRFLPAHKSHKILAQMYQAIRIEVNQEMDVLKEFLEQSLEILKPGGRLVVISYHSLEDRLVKRFIKNGMFEGEPEKDFFGNFSVPFKTIEKLIVPDSAEIKINNRARSAKLRVAEKR